MCPLIPNKGKPLAVLLLAISIFLPGLAGAQLLVNESFDYPGGDELSLHGWNNFLCCGQINVNNGGGLTQAGFGGFGNAVELLCCSQSAYFKPFSPVFNGDIYVSFLIHPTNSPFSSNEAMLNFYSSGVGGSFNYQEGFVLSNNNLSIKYGPGGANIDNGPFLNNGTTAIVVLGFNVNSNEFSLYYNPPLGGLSPPAPQRTDFSQIFVSSIDGISVINPTINADIFIDEIRVSTNWADVVAVQEPPDQPVGLFFTSASTTTISGTFTTAPSNPSGYAVFRGTGAFPVSMPVDNTAYFNGQVVGDATVVAFGSSTIFNDPALLPGTTYYYSIYSYNTDGIHYNYNLNGPLIGIQATEPVAPPSNLIFSSLAPTGVNLAYTAPPGNLGGYLVMRSTSSNSPPVDGTFYGVGNTVGSSTVAYVGPLTNFTDGPLTQNLTYIYDVYAYGGLGPTNVNYTIGSLNSRVTLPPAAQPTGIAFSGRTTSSITVSFTSAAGSPQSYLLIYKTGSSPTNGAPVDGSSYSVGNSLGTGTVGGVGTGPFTINSLALGTQYFFDIYSFNGTGTYTNYLEGVTPLEGSAYTLVAEPTGQPTILSFNTITPTGFNGSFTAAAPVPTGYIALRKQLSAVTDNPVDGTVYSVGNTIGASTVAFIGSGTAFSESGLVSATSYYYKIFSYGQAADPTTVNYYTGGTPLTNSQSTLAAPVATQASNIVFSAITNVQQTLTWTSGTGGRRIVLAHAGATVNSNPVNAITYTANTIFGSGTQIGTGNYVVYDGTGNSVSVTGLTAATVYYYEVFEYNGTGLTANYLTTTATNNPLSQTTLAVPASTQSSSIAFSGISPSQLTLTWTSGNGARRIVLGHAAAAVNSNPANGTTYTANAVFLSGTQIGTGNYVVYDGTGNSVTVTGLTASTAYNFQVFEYNGTTTTINYLTATATGNPAGQTSLAAAVGTQATNILFSGMTTTSMTLNWTNGSGTSRLVLAHSAAAVNSNPVNGTAYTANAAFGTGTQIGTGNYVVYDGAGSTVTATGLSPTTVYYFEVFEYNGTAGAQNYLTTTAAGNPGNQTTITGPPTVQATNIVFSGISNIQLSLNWTSGNGTNRLVLAHAGSTVNSNPANGTTYTANTIFGSGNQIGTGNYVVYNGAGSSVTVTGLTAATVYYFEVFEYTGAAATSNYLTTTVSGNPNNQTTLAAPASVQALNIFFSNSTNNSMTVGWTNGNGASRIVLARAVSTINSNPVSGTGYTANTIFGSGTQIGSGNYVVYNGTGSTVIVTGLSGATTYYFEVYEYNGSAATANYLTSTASVNPSNQVTLADPPGTQASNIVFSSITNNQMTIGWTSGSGSNRLVLLQAGGQSNDIIANGINYTANSMFGSGTAVGSHFVIYNGIGNSAAVTGLSPSTVYYAEVFEYNGSLSTANYLAITASGNPANQTTLAGPVATQASNILFSGIANNAATLTWTPGTGARRLVVGHAGAPVDSNPLNGTTYSANGAFALGSQIGSGNYVVFDGTGTSLTVTGLSAGSTYNFEVFEYNGSGGDNNFKTSTATGNPALVTTLADPPVLNAATVITQSGFTASWSTVAGATQYWLDVSADDFVSYAGVYHDFVGTGTSQGVTGLAGGTNYKFRVRAYNGSLPSAYSTSQPALTMPDTPVATAGTVVTTTSFTANWNAVTGATDYFLDVATDNAFSNFFGTFNNKQITGMNSALISGLTAATRYYYRVRAKNASGTTTNSNPTTQFTVTEAPVSLPATPVDGNSFIASWDLVPGADGYELEVCLRFNNFTTLIPGYNPDIIVGGDITEEPVTGLTPSTYYNYRVRARNAGGTSANSLVKLATTTNSSGGGVAPAPTITITDNQNSTQSVKGLVSGGSGIISVVLSHRKISETNFTSENPVAISSTSVEIPISAGFLDELGMEYFFTVTDELSRSSNSLTHSFVYRVFPSTAISIINQATGGKSESYRIFSIPLQLASARIEDIFQPVIAQYGGIDKTKWRLVHYQGGQNVDYGAGLTNIDQGRGYWFNSIDKPDPISVAGSVIQVNQGKGFNLSLDAGFTQIGNPFPFNISWSDVLAQNANVPGISGVGNLYTYDAPHVTFNKDAAILNSWEGGFVHSNDAIQITIPVTIKQGRIGGSDPHEIRTRSLDQAQWFVPIRITQGITYNNSVGPGMHPDAEQGYDQFDDFTLPRFMNYLEMNSYHRDYHTPKFSRDIVPTASHYNWEFEVESNFDEHEAEFNWDNLSLGNNSAQLLLYDVAANMIVDMKKENNYRFEIHEKRLFKIFFGADEKNLLPDTNGLGRAYPNPFGQSTTIPFITSATHPEVQIAMYDMMGRKVRNVAGGTFEPGYHEAIWDGADEQGGSVAQGIYIYRLTGTNTPAQQGRVVLK